jgi:hypothetical protein
LTCSQANKPLAKAVFFKRLGEMRDRSFENQRYRASGLNLLANGSLPSQDALWDRFNCHSSPPSTSYKIVDYTSDKKPSV